MVDLKPPKHDVLDVGPNGRCDGGPTDDLFLFVVHTTQGSPSPGPGDRHGVARFLAGKSVGIPWIRDDEGTTRTTPIGCLGDNHACGLDDRASGCEQIGFAQWGRTAWLKDHRETVRGTAQIAAFELNRRGIPVTLAKLKKHVIGHVDDDRFGGCSTHWDPGPGYPYDVFRLDAMEYAAGMGWRVDVTKGEIRKTRRFRRLKGAVRYLKDRARKGFRVVLRRAPLSGGEVERV